MAEWQTRRTQNPLAARPCGFDSLLRHQLFSPISFAGTHRTNHESRLARDFVSKRYGPEGYGVEEFVPELGAAFFWADLDIAYGPREDIRMPWF